MDSQLFKLVNFYAVLYWLCASRKVVSGKFVIVADDKLCRLLEFLLWLRATLHKSLNTLEIKMLLAGPSGRSPAEIVVSSPIGGTDVCLLWVLCVVR